MMIIDIILNTIAIMICGFGVLCLGIMAIMLLIYGLERIFFSEKFKVGKDDV
jgi:hypothetical protein